MSKTEKEYVDFLHNTGFKVGSKYFKYFTFSYLITPFKVKNKKMMLTTDTAELLFPTPLPKNFKNFVEGLFKVETFKLTENHETVSFSVESVIVEQEPEFTNTESFILKSPLIIEDPDTSRTLDYR